MPLTANKSSGLLQVIFLQCSDTALALAGPMPESAEEISSTDALLKLTGLAEIEKLRIDRALNKTTKTLLQLTILYSKDYEIINTSLKLIKEQNHNNISIIIN